jgi:FkbM family methyltransferase
MALVLPGPLRRVLPARLVEPLRRLFWRLPNLRRRLPSGLELTVESPADWTLYNDIFVDGEYDESIRAVLADAPAGRPLTVLDLGANVGYFVLRLADAALRHPVDFRLVAVEPSSRLVLQFERRIVAQPVIAGRVRVVHGLAGRRNGEGRLFESPLHFEHSTMPRRRLRSVPVPYLDLDRLVDEWPEIDLLKCDVEGAELEMLQTYAATLLPKVRHAVIELHHDRCDTARCVELLAAAGLSGGRVVREAYGCSVLLTSRATKSL